MNVATKIHIHKIVQHTFTYILACKYKNSYYKSKTVNNIYVKILKHHFLPV